MVKKHGLSNTRVYRILRCMKDRCYNEKHKAYKDYGGRGITICDEWLNDLMNFYEWAMSSGYRDDLTIDRIDVNGNYEPSNCRWITLKDQNLNCRRNVMVEYNGETKTLKEWSDYFSIDYALLYNRYKVYKWDFESAVKTPIRIQSSQRNVEICGEEHTIHDWSNITNINENLILRRICRGWSAEDAISTPVKRRLITVNGETHSISEWAKITGEKKRTIRNRVDNGWSDEEIVNPLLRKANIFYDGKLRSVKEFSLLTGIRDCIIHDGIRNGLSADDILRSVRKKRELTVDGQTRSIKEWSKETGIKVKTIYCRLSNGWSEEDAVKKPVRK